MSVYYGTVKDDVVVLPRGVHLTEGLEVEVRTLLSKLKHPQRALPPEHFFKQRLLESGLVKEITTASLVLTQENRAPLIVKDKPLSQMIIEERR